MSSGIIKTFGSNHQTALYMAKDKRLYEIVSIDSDCAVMAAFNDTFAVAAKPFLDEVNNVIDYSSIDTLTVYHRRKATVIDFINALTAPKQKKTSKNNVSR